MKKLLTALVLFSALLLFKGYAQTNTAGCNPDFTFQSQSGSTVKFNSSPTFDGDYLRHYWRFGDGSSPSSIVSTIHLYAPGQYNVTHLVIRRNPNGVIVCTDSLIKKIGLMDKNVPKNG